MLPICLRCIRLVLLPVPASNGSFVSYSYDMLTISGQNNSCAPIFLIMVRCAHYTFVLKKEKQCDSVENVEKKGPVRESNPGPLAP